MELNFSYIIIIITISSFPKLEERSYMVSKSLCVGGEGMEKQNGIQIKLAKCHIQKNSNHCHIPLNFFMFCTQLSVFKSSTIQGGIMTTAHFIYLKMILYSFTEYICLYILNINPLSVISFANIFSHSVSCLFVLLTVSFAV